MNLYVLNSRTGKEPEPAMLSLPCDGDRSTYLTDCGLDIRPYFETRIAHPVTFRIVHGHFAASMLRPTRRERFRGWRYTHYRALVRGLVLALNLLALYVAVCLVMDGANAVADWISR
jgi:hypothetical protein